MSAVHTCGCTVKRTKIDQERSQVQLAQRILLAGGTPTDSNLAEVGGASFEQTDRIPALSQDRPSTYGLIDQLFTTLDTEHGPLTGFNAIPDGLTSTVSNPLANGDLVRLRDVMGCSLPARVVTLKLFDVFIDSVHWFMMVFHEPSLRADLEEMLNTGTFPRQKLSTIILVMVVLLIGTKYVLVDEIPPTYSSHDLSRFQAVLLEKIEARFLAVLDQDDVGAIQVCVLLSSFYFYHGRPHRCLAMNSAATRLAQGMKLHRESTWRVIDPIEREVRRRVWWAVYVLDGYGALTYGTTNSIQHSKCQVELPQNIDDTLETCPGIGSYEVMEDGSSRRVTTLSYQRFKFRLYCIAEPIMKDVYFNDRRSVREVVNRIQAINAQLLEWQDSVPPELDLKNVSRHSLTHSRQYRSLRVFQVQALALQLAYDNIQLVLHRTLLFHIKGSLFRPPLNMPETMDEISEDVRRLSSISKDICWKAATRTSCIDRFPDVLKQSRNCHVGGYTGVQTFTAGFVLGIFALSQPLSTQAQEAKRAIGRLIKMPRLFGYRTAISDQTENILQRLLRVILDQEMRLLTVEGNHSALDSSILDGANANTLESRAQTVSGRSTQDSVSRRTPPARRGDDFAPAGALLGDASERVGVRHDTNPSDFDQGYSDSFDTTANSAWINFDMSGILTDTSFMDDINNIGQGWIWDDVPPFP
ncbi:uncharacterized protein AB675_3872 [Cyphellophora attinorum]|uniref:Xylanolytic transcriptional activator regulatory domain-containing protein n=1 Tax=Cyphellophora attinorum TaxID=1664694 RepID=A0A0N1GWT8_9EURO|nr:uncharacterized protein AB675_3872 [Phialophora attinorum]KPI34413.1 hypothetical protein AB675_3872 [Phialophora attinorum]